MQILESIKSFKVFGDGNGWMDNWSFQFIPDIRAQQPIQKELENGE
jgi:hypothetical protein